MMASDEAGSGGEPSPFESTGDRFATGLSRGAPDLSGDLLRVALEVTADGVWDCDLVTGHLHHSRRFVKMLGYTPQEIEPTAAFWQSLIHPEDLPGFRTALTNHIKGKTEQLSAEYRMRDRAGDWRWILSRGTVVSWDKDLRATRIIGTQIDITEAKRTESALRESEERLRAFLDRLDEVAYRADKEGVLTYVNKASEPITGRPVEEVVGQHFLPLFAPESQEVAARVHQETLEGATREYELTFRTGRVCHFRNEPIRDDAGCVIGVLGVARDVTNRTATGRPSHEFNRQAASTLRDTVARLTEKAAVLLKGSREGSELRTLAQEIQTTANGLAAVVDKMEPGPPPE